MIIYILICYGLTQILCYGKIFDKIRPNNPFFRCSMCIGFWTGLIVYLLMFLSTMNPFASFCFVDMLFASCLSSGTSYILDKLVGDKGINTNVQYSNKMDD
jgi:hypothetical protein